MRNAAILCLAPLLLVFFSEAHAQSKTWENCVGKTSTNPDWAQCGGDEVARQEARLNAAWKKAYACFDTADPTQRDARQSFLDEQRAWIKWKDSACAFYYPSKDGDAREGYAGREGQVLSAPICTASIVTDRARWLENFVKDCR